MENMNKLVKAITFTGLIAITGILLSCDNGNSPAIEQDRITDARIVGTWLFVGDDAHRFTIKADGEYRVWDPSNILMTIMGWGTFDGTTLSIHLKNYSIIFNQDDTITVSVEGYPLFGGVYYRGRERDGTWKDVIAPRRNLRTVHPITAKPIYNHEGSQQVWFDPMITDTVKDVSAQAYSMKRNASLFMGSFADGLIGAPSDEFLQSILDFQLDFLRTGHPAINAMLANLSSHVDAGDRDLFMAYVNAYRGINLMSAKQYNGYGIDSQYNNGYNNDDYTLTINLGSGPVTMAVLLQNVNDANGAGTDYSLSGQYPPLESLRAAAIALLPDDAYRAFGNEIIADMGNFEQLMGVIQRAQSFGKTATFTAEAMLAIGRDLDYYGPIGIDKPGQGNETGQ